MGPFSPSTVWFWAGMRTNIPTATCKAKKSLSPYSSGIQSKKMKDLHYTEDVGMVVDVFLNL